MHLCIIYLFCASGVSPAPPQQPKQDGTRWKGRKNDGENPVNHNHWSIHVIFMYRTTNLQDYMDYIRWLARFARFWSSSLWRCPFHWWKRWCQPSYGPTDPQLGRPWLAKKTASCDCNSWDLFPLGKLQLFKIGPGMGFISCYHVISF